MKLWTIIVVGVIAAVITFGQWAVVMGNDAFAAYGPENHKVFTYRADEPEALVAKSCLICGLIANR